MNIPEKIGKLEVALQQLEAKVQRLENREKALSKKLDERGSKTPKKEPDAVRNTPQPTPTVSASRSNTSGSAGTAGNDGSSGNDGKKGGVNFVKQFTDPSPTPSPTVSGS